MPSKRAIFTPLSILFRPHQNITNRDYTLVEAPGTAPGSNRFISPSIYYHSWQASSLNIDEEQPFGKGGVVNILNPLIIYKLYLDVAAKIQPLILGEEMSQNDK